MKSGLKWMVLAVAILVSTSAWAVWDPNTDAALVFNMNFDVGYYDNGAHTATDAEGGLVGTVIDYNETYPDLFGETSGAGLGKDANFAAMHDISTGAAIQSTGEDINDVRLTVPSNTGIFDLGLPDVKHTWTLWFNAPSLSDGTMIRHASAYAYMYLIDPETYNQYKNFMWEIRIYGGKLQFYHKNNCLRMETAASLSELGVTVNTWHHVAVVIDRSNTVETSTPTTQLSTKIYVDGLEAPVIVTALNVTSMDVDAFYDSPLWLGAGEREFDGLLDDIRLFSRVLTPVEVSILNQPDKTNPRALLPIPRSSSVVISTDLTWAPATGATAQTVYFGTATDQNNLPSILSGSGSLSQVTNAGLSGPLTLNKKYYWYIKSTVSGVDSNGPLWSFNTETGKAINPSPLNNAEDVNTTDVNLTWTTPTAATYSVYLSQDPCAVAASSVSVRIANGISVTNVNDVDTNSRGTTYYWRVNSTYPSSGTVAGDIWSFRTKAYELVFNTAGVERTYADHAIPAYTCLAHADGWSDACATGSLASDGVAVFNFPSGFNYDKRFDVVVVPAYRATDVCSVIFPTPLAIHVTGNFYFDGRVQIAGDDILTTTQAITFARSGGFAGPKNNQDSSAFNDRTTTVSDYWTVYSMPVGYHGRFGTMPSAHTIFVPTALAKSVWGPGQPVNPPYKGGGGGGSGGRGGDSGRGYFFGVNTEGPSYGDKEVPVPFGGSSGGWGGGSSPGGAAGGGGIEIVATGNVVLDSNSQIKANGGGQLCSAAGYPAGGGGGGSVRIIAGGSVTNKGTINVNGGIGGKGNQTNNTGGGGGGGRVAIFHATTFTNDGTITANGGERGTFTLTLGLAQDGENGTIFSTSGSPKKASAPTPANGDNMVYCNPDPCTNFQLKWYSGYGGTTDEVFCDNSSNPTTSRGSVSATRGQHSVTMTNVPAGQTYYWKVVTDGVSSDTWSFTTVNWRCRQYDGADVAPTDPNHVSGPEWDYNRDCVLDIEDFEHFADVWLNPAFDPYVVDFVDYNRFANEWRECFNRTDGGCAGY